MWCTWLRFLKGMLFLGCFCFIMILPVQAEDRREHLREEVASVPISEDAMRRPFQVLCKLKKLI